MMIRLRPALVLAAFTASVLLPRITTAQETAAPIIRVEEDWIVYVANPDEKLGAPQITNVIAPVPSTDGAFGLVELNHGTEPSFDSGGFQVQGWVGAQNHNYAWSLKTSRLRHAYDKLEYTVGVEVAGDAVRFSLKNGRSKTWGRFAKDPLTAVSVMKDAHLSAYDPQFSVDNTSINVGAHRVELMYQNETRYYSSDGLVRTDETPRVLHRFQKVVEFVSLEEYEQREEYYNIAITEDVSE